MYVDRFESGKSNILPLLPLDIDRLANTEANQKILCLVEKERYNKHRVS